MELDYVHVVLTLGHDRPVSAPFELFELKQPFERAFHSVAGERVYSQVFSQSLSPDRSAVKRFQKPSLPFVFRVPVLQSQTPDTTCELGLIVLGWAIPFLPNFITALKKTLSDPRFRASGFSLLRSESVSFYGNRHSMDFHSDTRDLNILSFAKIPESGTIGQKLRIRLDTPLRLVREGKPSRIFSWSHFIRTVFRRVSSALYYAGNVEPVFDFKWLATVADETAVVVQEVGVVSSGGKAGLVGEVVVAGVYPEIELFLRAGELLGIGKGATYGYGRYSLEAVQ